jgi:cobalamin biosynthesis Mg chelatase CobN
MGKKKKMVLVTSVVVGTLAIGGTAYAVTSNINHQSVLDNTKNVLKSERSDLRGLKAQLSQMVDSKGYLTETATHDNLDKIKKDLNSMRDSYIDFQLSKDDLKDEFKVLKIDKQSVERKWSVVNNKLNAQDAVNALFNGVVINGSTVQSLPIKDRVTADQVANVRKTYLDGRKDSSDWFKALKSLVSDANNQLKQIDKATQAVNALFKGGKVVDGVSRDDYNKAKTEVNKVKNATVKSQLNGKLAEVLKVVKANEAKAKAEAEAKAKEQQQKTTSNQAVKSSNGSSSYNKSSGSTVKGSQSKTTTSHKEVKSSSKTVHNKSEGKSKTGKIKNVKVTGGGTVKNYGGDGESAHTWEGGTFDGSDIPDW